MSSTAFDFQRFWFDLSNVRRRGVWNSGAVYSADDLVRVSGVWYIALEGHDAAEAFSLDLAAGKWQTFEPRGVSMVANYAAMRLLTGTATSAYVTGYLGSSAPSGIAGLFTRDDTDTTSADNGGTIIVASNGKRWKRVYSGEISPLWFGATRSLSSSVASANTAAIQAAIDAAHLLGGGTVRLQGKFGINGNVNVKRGVKLLGSLGRAEWQSAANADGLWCVSGTGYDAVTISGTAASIFGLTIANSPQTGIAVTAGDCTIGYCEVFHPLGTGITSSGSVTQIEWTHVVGPAKHGILLSSGDNKIVSCEFQQPNSADGGGSEPLNSYDCIHITGSAPQQILNCRFGDDIYRSRAGVYLNYAGGGGGVQIIGNDFQNFTQAGLHIAAGTAVVGICVIGNKFVSGSVNASKCAIRNDVAVQDLLVVGNYFNATGLGALGAFYFNAALTKATIRANTYTGNWASGSNVYNWVTATDRDTSSDNGSVLDGWSASPDAPAIVGRTLTGATPSVLRGASADLFWLNNAGATTVTDFLNGYTGQEIALLAVNGNTTIQHANAKIRLLNNEDWTMPIYSVLRLKKAASTFTFGAIWYETGRTVSGAVSGTTGLSVGGDGVIFRGTGTPEGAVTAPVGCMYLRKDGGASTTLYVKESGIGNTGWVGK